MLLALHTFPGSLHPFIWNSREISQQPKFLSWWNFVHTLGNANLLKKKRRSGAGEVEFLRSTGMVQWEQHTQGTGWTSWSQRSFSNLENAGILCWSTGNTSPGEGRAAIPPWAGENWWISVGKPKIPHQERRSAAAPVEIVDVGFTSRSQERLKSKLILVLFGCFFFQPSSTSVLLKFGQSKLMLVLFGCFFQPSSTSAVLKFGINVPVYHWWPCVLPPPPRCALHPSLVIFSLGLCSPWFQLNWTVWNASFNPKAEGLSWISLDFVIRNEPNSRLRSQNRGEGSALPALLLEGWASLMMLIKECSD